jgi:hypothetical protein
MVAPPMVEPTQMTSLRRKLALLFLAIGVLSLTAVLPIVLTPLSRQATLVLTGFFLFGIPQLSLLASIAVVGRPSGTFFTSGFARSLRLIMPASTVGWARYRVGLLLFTVALLVSWIEPVISDHFSGLVAHSTTIGILADALLLAALWVLGAEFWDKLHALFMQDAKVSGSMTGNTEEPATTTALQVGWRFYLGAVLFTCTFAAWALVPLASTAGWETAQLASLSGGIFAANKIVLLVAVAVMGKSGFSYLKRLIFAVLRRIGPPDRVSRGRYRIGLVVFTLAFILDWLMPYVVGVGGRDAFHGMIPGVSVGLLLVAGLCVLGGEFWGKLRALFSYQTKVEAIVS